MTKFSLLVTRFFNFFSTLVYAKTVVFIDIAACAVGLGFDSPIGQVGHGQQTAVTNDGPRHSLLASA